MRRYARVEGLLIEPVGHLWIAFSPASGETALLNEESIAILELLEQGSATVEDIVAALAASCEEEPASLQSLVADSWSGLVDAGLVREVAQAAIS